MTIAHNRTLALIKPDAVRHGPAILEMIKLGGFIATHVRLKHLTAEMAELLYQQHREQLFFPILIVHMISGPIWVMILEKENAVEEWRNLLGPTNPAHAPGNTIRGRFWNHEPLPQNVAHGSDSVAAAQREIGLFYSAFDLMRPPAYQRW